MAAIQTTQSGSKITIDCDGQVIAITHRSREIETGEGLRVLPMVVSPISGRRFVWLSVSGGRVLCNVDVGIPSKKQGEIFTELGQVGTLVAREQEGTGLGLSISKHIVELHGGEIGVESEVEKGSMFWFRILMEP